MIEDTSIKAYAETEELRQAQKMVVYDMVKQARHPSSSDIARFTRLPRTSVTARLKKLEDDGMIKKGGTKRDPHTGKTVNWYKVIE